MLNQLKKWSMLRFSDEQTPFVIGPLWKRRMRDGPLLVPAVFTQQVRD